MNYKRLIDVAAGRKTAELVLKNGSIVNVFTGEVYQGDVAVDQGVIAGVGAYNGKTETDIHGRYIIPGLIDAHVHIESSMVSPEQFARLVVPYGTTTVVTDPHEIANVKGFKGIEYMMAAAEQVPLDALFMLSSCVPATDFENSGAVLDWQALDKMIHDERILGLGEMMDYPGVISGNDNILNKLSAARNAGKPIDGHGPGIEGRELSAYRAAGIKTDHECSTLKEMRNRLRLGMYILIREGSAARNLETLIKGVNAENMSRCCFCTDDKHPGDIMEEGHINYCLRLAVKNGVEPAVAVRMATLNSAECYGLKNKGAVAPGYTADLAVVNNLTDFKVTEVYKSGIPVAKEEKALFSVPQPDISDVDKSVQVADLKPDSFRLYLESDFAHVIHLHPQSLTTEKTVRKVHRDKDGYFLNHNKLDILKLAVVERHKKSGNIGLGLVENFGICGGAIATTVAHDSHNIIVVGDNDKDMLKAVREITRAEGGMTVCAGGEILETLSLPIGGLMSNRSAEEVSETLKRINNNAYKSLGISPNMDPFSTLSFLALPVIPELKLTDMGLFDVTSFSFIPVSVKESHE